MKKFNEIISKPSEALEAMIKGLRKYSRRKNFEVNMSHFGGSSEGICFGCAATCTVQQIINKDFTPTTIESAAIRSIALDVVKDDLDRFEYAIDNARSGMMGSLFRYFSININAFDFDTELLDPGFKLGTDNWTEQLPKVRNYIKKIKALGY
jgi:hypothetical protein